MRPRWALAPVLAALGGCAVVVVHADGGRPQLSAWPLGVRVERGDGAAVSVNVQAVGVVSGPQTLAVGLSSLDADVIDARCSVALVHAPVSDPRPFERLAGATKAECFKPEGEP